MTIILIFGIFGNAFALIAITYAKVKKECFRESWRTSTLFYFNLILVDITYCLLVSVHMVNSLLIYLKVIDDDDGHEKTCHFFVLGEQTLATIGGWSIASIVFIQAIPRLKYEKSYMLEFNRSSNYNPESIFIINR